jgi:hypothetical protein
VEFPRREEGFGVEVVRLVVVVSGLVSSSGAGNSREVEQLRVSGVWLAQEEVGPVA